MLSRVIAKNFGDVFLRHTVEYNITTMKTIAYSVVTIKAMLCSDRRYEITKVIGCLLRQVIERTSFKSVSSRGTAIRKRFVANVPSRSWYN